MRQMKPSESQANKRDQNVQHQRNGHKMETSNSKLVDSISKTFKDPMECAQVFNEVKKRKSEDGYAIDVNSLKEQLAKRLPFDSTSLTKVQGFEDNKKLHEYFGIKSTDSFETQKAKLNDLESSSKLIIQTRNELQNTLDKNILLSNIESVVKTVCGMFTDGVGAAIAAFMEMLALAYLTQQSSNTYDHFSLEFYTENATSYTFYFIDIAITAVHNATWYLPLVAQQKDTIKLQVLNVIGFTPDKSNNDPPT